MQVFVTGATGFIGSAVVQELIRAGHTVVGLARSDASAKALVAAGAKAHRGALDDPKSLSRGAADADGAIHLAFMHEFTDASLTQRGKVMLGGRPGAIVSRFMAATTEADRRAIDAMGSALEGSGRPLVVTFGTMGLTPGQPMQTRPATEDDAPDPRSPGAARAANEAVVQGWAQRGVRASIVRLAPSVHGDGDTGLVPRLIGVARKSGASAYVGEGKNRWSGVHRLDAARLFRLALEQGVAGAHYHGVADEGVPFRQIAEVISRQLGVPARSIDKAGPQFSWLGPFISVDNPASSALTQEQLGWRPSQPGLLTDLDRPSYFTT